MEKALSNFFKKNIEGLVIFEFYSLLLTQPQKETIYLLFFDSLLIIIVIFYG